MIAVIAAGIAAEAEIGMWTPTMCVVGGQQLAVTTKSVRTGTEYVCGGSLGSSQQTQTQTRGDKTRAWVGVEEGSSRVLEKGMAPAAPRLCGSAMAWGE